MNQVYKGDFVIMCSKMISNTMRCGCVAVTVVHLKSIKTGKDKIRYRCHEHRGSKSIRNKWIISSKESFDQSFNIEVITEFLKTFIDERVYSKHHGLHRYFIGKYIKNVGIMCLDQRGKWQYVYYNQIRIK